MLNVTLGQKVRMEQAFIEGKRVPVTVVATNGCQVTQIKTLEKNGHWAVQLGLGRKKNRKTESKKQYLPKFIKEFQTKNDPEVKIGDQVKASDIFVVGDAVAVTAISKGKGFAGVVKRWRFAGGPKTHGQSDRLRAPGSIGQGTSPGRIHKGKHMAGRMGGEQTTVKNLKVVETAAETGLVKLSGPIPGSVGSLVILKKI